MRQIYMIVGVFRDVFLLWIFLFITAHGFARTHFLQKEIIKMVYTADSHSKKEALDLSDLVITAKIKNLGTIEPEGMGQTYFYKTVVDSIVIEKGTLNKRSLSVCYQVVSFENGKPKKMPEKGKKYRFYISISEDEQTYKAFRITDL